MSRLELEDVGVAVRGRELLSQVSLELRAGELKALVGPNGAGKTTLLRTALGLLRPVRGSVRVDGQDVRSLRARVRAAAIGWLPQDQSASEAISALSVVSAARYRFDEPLRRTEAAALAALERVGAAALAEARITELSGGERQRVALAALFAQEARLLLLDEPASHLDPAHQLESYRLLGELRAAGLGVLVVTHDVNVLAHLGDASLVEVIGLRRGRIAFHSALTAADLPERLSALFDVRFEALSSAGRRVLVAHDRLEPGP